MVRRSDAGTADVYNLTIEGQHEFFANGVLVHNCDALRYMLVNLDSGPQFVTGLPNPNPEPTVIAAAGAQYVILPPGAARPGTSSFWTR